MNPGLRRVHATETVRGAGVRKESEQNLAQMEGRYRGLLEAAPDAMVAVDQAGDIVLLNVQAERQFGYPRDELLGQKVMAIIPEGFAERLIADGTRSAAEALAQQIGTGIELTGLRKNGSEFPLELMLSPLDQHGAEPQASSYRGRGGNGRRACFSSEPTLRRGARRLFQSAGARAAIRGLVESRHFASGPPSLDDPDVDGDSWQEPHAPVAASDVIQVGGV